MRLALLLFGAATLGCSIGYLVGVFCERSAHGDRRCVKLVRRVRVQLSRQTRIHNALAHPWN